MDPAIACVAYRHSSARTTTITMASSLQTFTGFTTQQLPSARRAGAKSFRARTAHAIADATTTMKKKSVGDLTKKDLEGQTVFVRCDLNVPLDKDLNITDDTRIRAAIPTLEYLVKNGAKVLVTSHLVSAMRCDAPIGWISARMRAMRRDQRACAMTVV